MQWKTLEIFFLVLTDPYLPLFLLTYELKKIDECGEYETFPKSNAFIKIQAINISINFQSGKKDNYKKLHFLIHKNFKKWGKNLKHRNFFA